MNALRKKAGRIVAGWLKTERDHGWLWGDGIDKADANFVGTWLFLRPMSVADLDSPHTFVGTCLRTCHDLPLSKDHACSAGSEFGSS